MTIATPRYAYSTTPTVEPAAATGYPLGYNPALDGLRAVAVVAVMFHHFDLPGSSGGVFGVDVFFVLSGYLITSLLTLSIDRGQPLGVFYWQRFLRLAPPLILICAALLAISPWLGALSQGIADSLAALLYVSDWTAAFHAEGVPMFLGNTWSLAIEEQFYLLWPLLLRALLRRGDSRLALTATIGLLAASLLWQQWVIAGEADYERLYFAFDTRCGGLMIGCAVALSGEQLRRVRRILRPAGLLGAALLLLIPGVSWMSWTPLTSLGVSLAAAMVIADLTVHRDGPIQRVLSLRAPVAVGRMSYSLYLWHYPIMLMIIRHFTLPKAAGAAVGIGLSVICATASFFIAEQPVRRLRTALSPRWTEFAGQSAASASLLGMIIGVGFFWQADIANLLNPKPIEIVGYGPRNLHRGETFNVQPDGSSMMWVRTSRSVPANARIRVGPDTLQTLARGTVTVAILPEAIRGRVGPATITIISADGERLVGPVDFEVSP